MAASRIHGVLVAPSIRILSLLRLTPWKLEIGIEKLGEVGLWESMRMPEMCQAPPHTNLHLHHKLGLDTTRRVTLAVRPRRAQRVDLETEGGKLMI